MFFSRRISCESEFKSEIIEYEIKIVTVRQTKKIHEAIIVRLILIYLSELKILFNIF